MNDLFCDTDPNDQPQDWRPINENLEIGLDTFNHFVRTQVPLHGVAISGIKKYKILSYAVAVLVSLQFFFTDDETNPDSLYMYDSWRKISSRRFSGVYISPGSGSVRKKKSLFLIPIESRFGTLKSEIADRRNP